MSERTRHAPVRRWIVVSLLCAAAVFSARAQPVREPAPGVFLVAAERMGDPRFTHSVVLLIEHDHTGSWGLIINKPTDIDPGEVLPTFEQSGDHPSVYFGGPVQVERLLGLYQDDAAPDDHPAGLPGVHWSDSPQMLSDRLEQAPDRVRVFAGYAGWGPGQLSFEIAHGGWKMIQGRRENVFSDDPEHLWERLSRALGGIAI